MNAYEHDMEFRRFLRMLEGVSLVGMLFAMWHISSTQGEMFYIIYASWFAVAIASAEAILNWFKVGVYALVLATGVVTLFEIASGNATLGGATLGALLIVVMVGYLQPIWERLD